MHIAKDAPDTAAQFVKQITDKISWIAESGHKGVPRDRVRPGLRALLYRDRCIYFRIDDRHVHVLRVLHTRQNVSKAAFGDP